MSSTTRSEKRTRRAPMCQLNRRRKGSSSEIMAFLSVLLCERFNNERQLKKKKKEESIRKDDSRIRRIEHQPFQGSILTSLIICWLIQPIIGRHSIIAPLTKVFPVPPLPVFSPLLFSFSPLHHHLPLPSLFSFLSSPIHILIHQRRF